MTKFRLLVQAWIEAVILLSANALVPGNAFTPPRIRPHGYGRRSSGGILKVSQIPESPNPLIWTPDLAPSVEYEFDVFADEDVQEQGRVFLPFENPLEKPSLNVGRFLVLVAAAIYGTNFASVKMLDDAMPLAVSASLRFSLGAAVVTSAVLAQEHFSAKKHAFVDPIESQERWLATLGGFEVGAWYTGGYLTQAIGLLTTDASKSSFFNALAVIVVPLLDSLLGGKILKRQSIVSVSMAIAGVALLQLGPPGHTSVPPTDGDIFCFLQALFFGIGYWRLEKVSQRFPAQASRNTVGQLCAMAVGSIAYCGVTTGMPSFESLQHWLSDSFIIQAILWTGLISTAFALYLETVATKVVSASELTILMTSVSLWGSGFAVLTMGETLSGTDLLGGLMILAGCVVSSFGSENIDAPNEVDADSTFAVDAIKSD